MACSGLQRDEIHSKELQKYCRVCAKKMNKGYKHLCSSSGSPLECFGVNVASDKCNIHLSHYCHNCHNTAKRLQKAGAESTLQAHSWCVHDDVQCVVCNMCSPLHTVGRQKKEKKKRGRPSTESNKGIANAIIQNAPKSWKATQPLSLSRFLPPATNLSLTDFQCAVCLHIVDRPVETPCRKLICADCISDRVCCAEDLTDMHCPCCKKS